MDPAVPLRAAVAIDVASPVPSEHWRLLRSWLEDMDLDVEPNVNPDVGLIGYTLRLRNYLLGIGLALRATGPVVSISAVLCRGMDREQFALAAADRANRHLTLGQVLYLPGPPAELSFFAACSMDLLDRETFALLFDAVLGELNSVGFPAVMAVRGYHPGDYAAPWGDTPMAPRPVEFSSCDANHASGCADAPCGDREADSDDAAAQPQANATADDDCAKHSDELDGDAGAADVPSDRETPRRRARRS